MFQIFLKAIVFAVVICAAAPIAALEKIESRSEFIEVLSGRDLNIRLYGLALSVTPDGQIQGRAVGLPVTGEWTWQSGYFCRSLTWGTRELPYNCQKVEVDGNTMRFTTDQGAGDYADFRLR